MTSRLGIVLAATLVLAWQTFAQQSYAGAQSCSPCHPAQAAAQAKSGHARSLHPAANHPLIGRFLSKDWLLRDPAFRYRFRVVDKQLRVQAYDEKNTIDIPVEWAFGAGEQAVTFVTRIDANWYLEHYYSYYSQTGQMGPTAGHSVLKPKDLAEAIGLPYKTLDPATGILGCFQCHSTGPVHVSADATLTPAEAGVRCEACHGPGREHIQAAAAGDLRKSRDLIRNPKRFTAPEMLSYCGECHRPPAGIGTKIDWNYSWNVRHQPVYLAESKCMTKSNGQLSCVTCHDPHAALKSDASSFYRERCLSCHNGETSHAVPAAACLNESSSDCVACHMPKVSPQPSLRFTNHWIGIFPDRQTLRPR